MVQLSLTRLDTFLGGSPISHADPCQLGTKTACRGVPVSRKIPPGVIRTVDNAWQDILPNCEPARMSTPNPWFPGTGHSFLDIILSGSEGDTAQNFIMCLLEGLHRGSRFWDVPPSGWICASQALFCTDQSMQEQISLSHGLIFPLEQPRGRAWDWFCPKNHRWDPKKNWCTNEFHKEGKHLGVGILRKKIPVGKMGGAALDC